MAIPLTGYCSPQGSYEGVDDWLEGIAWCQKAITTRFPNFQFRMLPESNSGSAEGEERTDRALPYDDSSFDFVLLGSILHLRPAEFEKQLREAARVIRPGGIYFGTWYLLDHDEPVVATEVPAIACCPNEMHEQLTAVGLSVEGIHRGRWNGHPHPLSYQDVVVARKESVET
jgi:SAM-dependent methyltransferase